MRTKRFISLLLLAVYLLAAGAPAWASLSCACVSSKTAAAHVCCCHCTHDGDASTAKADLTAPCCGHHHSTDVELYTGGSSEKERQARALTIDLSPALAPDAPATLDAPCVGVRIPLRQQPLPRQAVRSGASLRAPPALV